MTKCVYYSLWSPFMVEMNYLLPYSSVFQQNVSSRSSSERIISVDLDAIISRFDLSIGVDGRILQLIQLAQGQNLFRQSVNINLPC